MYKSERKQLIMELKEEVKFCKDQISIEKEAMSRVDKNSKQRYRDKINNWKTKIQGIKDRIALHKEQMKSDLKG